MQQQGNTEHGDVCFVKFSACLDIIRSVTVASRESTEHGLENNVKRKE